MTPINHEELAFSRLATQFRESSLLKAYIAAFIKGNQQLEDTFQSIINDRYLDNAVAAQLDTIGVIVGQPREFKEVVVQTYFGFKGSIGSGGFGTIGDPNVGVNFRSVSDAEFDTQLFDDDVYRKFIKSKIAKNSSEVTINEVIKAVLDNIETQISVEVVEGVASFRMNFLGILSDNDKLLLARTNFVPRPIGVSASFADDEGAFI